MVWFSALPSKLSPDATTVPATVFSAGLVPPHLRFRRATRKPLPETVPFIKRQALIRSSPIKARQFLGESFNSRTEHYDKGGRIMIKNSDHFLDLRKPKGKKLTKKEMRKAREEKKTKMAKKAKAARSEEPSAIDAYNRKIAELCERRKQEDNMINGSMTRFDGLIVPESPLLLRSGTEGHTLSADYYAKVTRSAGHSKFKDGSRGRKRSSKHLACIEIGGDDVCDVLAEEMELLL